MARGEEVPEAIRNQIVAMRKCGKSFVYIGNEYNMSEDTARKIYNRWVATGNCENAPRSGRPRLLNKHDVRHIKSYITTSHETRREPLSEIIQHCNLPVTTRTLSRTIDEFIRMGRRIERKRCFLSPKQIADRLKFASDHINWTLEDWR
jgi:transposase